MKKPSKNLIKEVRIADMYEEKLAQQNSINRNKYNPSIQPYLKKYKYVDENVKVGFAPEVYSLIKEQQPEPPKRDNKRFIPNPNVSASDLDLY